MIYTNFGIYMLLFLTKFARKFHKIQHKTLKKLAPQYMNRNIYGYLKILNYIWFRSNYNILKKNHSKSYYPITRTEIRHERSNHLKNKNFWQPLCTFCRKKGITSPKLFSSFSSFCTAMCAHTKKRRKKRKEKKTTREDNCIEYWVGTRSIDQFSHCQRPGNTAIPKFRLLSLSLSGHVKKNKRK